MLAHHSLQTDPLLVTHGKTGLVIGTAQADELSVPPSRYSPDLVYVFAGLGGNDSIFGTPGTDYVVHVPGQAEGVKDVHRFEPGKDKFTTISNTPIQVAETVSPDGFTGEPGCWSYKRISKTEASPILWAVGYDADGDRAPEFVAVLDAASIGPDDFLLNKPHFSAEGALTYDFLDAIQGKLRTTIGLYKHERAPQVSEADSHVLVLGPSSSSRPEFAHYPDLSSVSPEKPRIFVLMDRIYRVDATDRPDVFLLAAGESGPTSSMIVRGFEAGTDKIALLDLDGLNAPQSVVEGKFTGTAAQWRFTPSLLIPNEWWLEYDRDGDRKADYGARVHSPFKPLTKGDFLLGAAEHVRQSAPTYDELDEMRGQVRTYIQLYKDARLPQVMEDEGGVLVFGPRAMDHRDTDEEPDLSSATPGKPRTFIAVDSQLRVAATEERETFVIAAGESELDYDIMMISGFQPGYDKLALLDMDGLPHAQTAVESYYLTGTAAQWSFYKLHDRQNTWRVEYDVDGDGESEFDMTVSTADGALTANDFLLANGANEPVRSEYSPPSLAQRLEQDIPAMMENVAEHLDRPGLLARELPNTVLIFGADAQALSSLPAPLETDTKPTVFIASSKTQYVLASENPDVIAHFAGYSGAVIAVGEMETGVDKFAVLGEGSPQSVRRGTTFERPHEWIYEAYTADQIDGMPDLRHRLVDPDRSDDPNKKYWIVKYNGDDDLEADVTYLVLGCDSINQNDFLLNV